MRIRKPQKIPARHQVTQRAGGKELAPKTPSEHQDQRPPEDGVLEQHDAEMLERKLGDVPLVVEDVREIGRKQRVDGRESGHEQARKKDACRQTRALRPKQKQIENQQRPAGHKIGLGVKSQQRKKDAQRDAVPAKIARQRNHHAQQQEKKSDAVRLGRDGEGKDEMIEEEQRPAERQQPRDPRHTHAPIQNGAGQHEAGAGDHAMHQEGRAKHARQRVGQQRMDDAIAVKIIGTLLKAEGILSLQQQRGAEGVRRLAALQRMRQGHVGQHEDRARQRRRQAANEKTAALYCGAEGQFR